MQYFHIDNAHMMHANNRSMCLACVCVYVCVYHLICTPICLLITGLSIGSYLIISHLHIHVHVYNLKFPYIYVAKTMYGAKAGNISYYFLPHFRCS